MILNINNLESATLTLHMSIMRKSFRNLIKVKYKAEKKDFLNSYDYIHNESKKALELTQQDINNYEMHLNINDLEILREFLKSYTDKLSKEFKDQMQEEDKKQLETLTQLYEKCKSMIVEIS